MGEYLITARSVTHAQRMAQALAQNGFRAVIGRAPVGLTGSGCGYVLRVQEKRAVEATALLHSLGFAPARVFRRAENGYSEVEI